MAGSRPFPPPPPCHPPPSQCSCPNMWYKPWPCQVHPYTHTDLVPFLRTFPPTPTSDTFFYSLITLLIHPLYINRGQHPCPCSPILSPTFIHTLIHPLILSYTPIYPFTPTMTQQGSTLRQNQSPLVYKDKVKDKGGCHHHNHNHNH